MARAARRRQLLDLLQFEQDREVVLSEQLEETIVETLGAGVDEAAFARMDAADADLVRAAFGGDHEESAEEEFFEYGSFEVEEDVPDAAEEEIARLGGELEKCRRRQRAFEAYLAALAD